MIDAAIDTSGLLSQHSLATSANLHANHPISIPILENA